MKTVIIGGVAGGASCAARLRRLDEKAEIVMVERGPYVSYANCGLPYHVGGVIEDEASLLIANPELFRAQFAVDVRTSTEAVSIDPKSKVVRLRDVATGAEHDEIYDKLVLAPGAVSVKPPLPGNRFARHLSSSNRTRCTRHPVVARPARRKQTGRCDRRRLHRP